MRNFPFNVLGATQTVIGMQEFKIMKYQGRERNAAGYFTSEFEPPEPMKGSVQPVNSRQYKELGLDLKRAYIKIYSVDLIESISRDSNADQVVYDGYTWEVAEDTPWFLSGGWNFVLCVRLEKYCS